MDQSVRPLRKTHAKKGSLKLMLDLNAGNRFHQKKPSYTCGYMMIFGILPFGCESDMQRKKIKTQLNCSTSRQSEPSLAVLWFPHLTRSFRHRRCSSGHNSLKGYPSSHHHSHIPLQHFAQKLISPFL